MDTAIGCAEGNAVVLNILKEGAEPMETIKAAIVTKINGQVIADPVRSELNVSVGEAFA